MTLLVLGHKPSHRLQPPDRSRYWYAQLWKHAPAGARYTPEQARAVEAANWHLSSNELKTKATY